LELVVLEVLVHLVKRLLEDLEVMVVMVIIQFSQQLHRQLVAVAVNQEVIQQRVLLQVRLADLVAVEVVIIVMHKVVEV
jgi:hypothetical protein